MSIGIEVAPFDLYEWSALGLAGTGRNWPELAGTGRNWPGLCRVWPELDASFWAKAKVKPPQIKPNVSLRVSDDVVEFFKGDMPKGYTSRMVAVLEAYVQAHQQD